METDGKGPPQLQGGGGRGQKGGHPLLLISSISLRKQNRRKYSEIITGSGGALYSSLYLSVHSKYFTLFKKEGGGREGGKEREKRRAGSWTWWSTSLTLSFFFCTVGQSVIPLGQVY